MGSVIIDDLMEISAGRGLAIDLVKESNEFLVSVVRHTLRNDAALQDIERSEQRGRAMALVVMAHRATTPLLHRSPGCVLSSAWICDFSSTDRTSACSGGLT